jgi:hypothetical protein
MQMKSTLKVAAVMLVALSSLTSCNNLSDQAFDAFRGGDLVKVKALLKDNPKVVSSSDLNGWTPLHITAKYGHKDVAELLLAKGAAVNAKADDGETPLDLALAKGHWDVAELLRQHGAATGMAKVKFDRVAVDIPFTECPHSNVLDPSYCVPAGYTRVGVEYSESALAYTEEPVYFPVTFVAGHTYTFKAKETYGVVTFWVEDAADGSVVAGQRPY